MMITSNQNQRFKTWKKLLTKKGRKNQEKFIVEGEHLVAEALRSGWPVSEVIISEDFQVPEDWRHLHPSLLKNSTVLPASLFAELSETETPQGVAVVMKPKRNLPIEEHLKGCKLVLCVDQVQDSGNVGTLIRTADAAGVDAIIMGQGTADTFSGKVLRSTQGSIFHIPIYEQRLEDFIPYIQQQRWQAYGTSLHEAEDYRDIPVDQEQKIAIVVGNEGQGIDQKLLKLMDLNIKIPIWGKAESLNVAIAAAILLYHLQYQRKK